MAANISFNPYATSQPQDSFLLQSQGLIQGTAYADPTARMELMGGYVDSGETLPMWGGVPINEMINLSGSGNAQSDGLGPSVKRSTTQATITGFSVFDQASSMVITAGNTVPLAANLNYMSFYRLGTNARIAVQCDPAIITALNSSNGDISSQALYWDTTNFRITLVTASNFALPTSVRLVSVNVNSKIVAWSSPNATWTTGDAAVILI